jgi:hypothetical protein
MSMSYMIEIKHYALYFKLFQLCVIMGWQEGKWNFMKIAQIALPHVMMDQTVFSLYPNPLDFPRGS